MRISAAGRTAMATAIVFVALIFGWALRRSTALEAQPPPARGAKSDIVVRGHIEPVGRVLTLQGPAGGGVLEKLNVIEGQHVEAGQILALLEGYDTQVAAVSMAERTLAYSTLLSRQVAAGAKQSDVDAQRNVVESKTVEVRRARRELERAEALLSQQMVSQQELDRARAESGVADAALEQTQHVLVALGEVREVDKAVAESRRAIDVAALSRSRAELERCVVRAPIAGSVLSITTRQGEAIAANGILRLAALESLMVIAEVDERFMPRLQADAGAFVGGPLVPQPVQARIRYLGKEVFRQARPNSDTLIGRDARVVEVELLPEAPLPAVLGGEVEVRFVPRTP
jgi:HlyD family secretion protein